MKTLLKTNLFFELSRTVLLCFGITALSYGQAVVSVDPAESPSPGVGSQLTISLKITSGRNVAAYEVGVNFRYKCAAVRFKHKWELPTRRCVFRAAPSLWRQSHGYSDICVGCCEHQQWHTRQRNLSSRCRQKIHASVNECDPL